MVQHDFPKGKNVCWSMTWIFHVEKCDIYRWNEDQIIFPMICDTIFCVRYPGHTFNKTFLPFGKSRCTIAQHLTWICSRYKIKFKLQLSMKILNFTTKVCMQNHGTPKIPKMSGAKVFFLFPTSDIFFPSWFSLVKTLF